MTLLKTQKFEKTYKKLHENQKNDVIEAIKKIVDNPYIGEQKKGDLRDFFVYKFKMVKQLTLLAYRYEEEQIILTLVALGTHENFYRDLKTH